MNSTRRARCKQGEILARGKRGDGQGEVVVPLLQRRSFSAGMFVYSKEELQGHPLYELVLTAVRISEKENLENSLADGHIRVRVEELI